VVGFYKSVELYDVRKTRMMVVNESVKVLGLFLGFPTHKDEAKHMAFLIEIILYSELVGISGVSRADWTEKANRYIHFLREYLYLYYCCPQQSFQIGRPVIFS